MESGLDGRNNGPDHAEHQDGDTVSMESGLDGRNNPRVLSLLPRRAKTRLNGVRPRWPEQWLASEGRLD